MAEPLHKVVAKSDETAQFQCGHVGPVDYAHVFFGQEYRVKPEFAKKSPKCAQCLLDLQTATLAQCVRCKRPIFKGQSCIVYDYDDPFGVAGLCCLSTMCGMGPIGGLPGIWDGTRFVNGFEAGTIRTFDMGTLLKKAKKV